MPLTRTLGGSHQTYLHPLMLPGLQFFLDAGDTATITDAGSGAVSQWDDQGPHRNHVKQATGANRPVTGTQTLNGRNVIDFTPNQYLVGDNYDLDVSTRELTWFAVFKWDDNGTGRGITSFQRTAQTTELNTFLVESNASAQQCVFGNGAATFAVPNLRERVFTNTGITQYLRLIATMKPGDHAGPRLLRDGVWQSLADGGGSCAQIDYLSVDSTPWRPWVGVRGFPAFYLDGKIATVGMTNQALPNPAIHALDRWLQDRWGNL